MSSSEERTARSFVERHVLWNDEQFEAAASADKWIEEHGLEVVRLSFPDQHGILRGKTVVATEAAAVMRNGCSLTTTLLAKDTAQKTVFPVFTPGGGFGMPEMDNCLVDGFGRSFIDYYLRIKDAEIARYQSEVTEWEQREYFELF